MEQWQTVLSVTMNNVGNTTLFKLIFHHIATTNLFSLLHCYHQEKIRWLERDLNSHLRISRPPLYPLGYRVNGDWWRVLSNLSGRNIFAMTKRLSWRTRSVSIQFQNHPRSQRIFRSSQQCKNENKLVFHVSEDDSEIHCSKLIIFLPCSD